MRISPFLLPLSLLLCLVTGFVLPQFNSNRFALSTDQPLLQVFTSWIASYGHTHKPRPLKVFLTGGTGYIGGQFLHELLHNDQHNFKIRALVRTADKAEALSIATNYRVEAVLGDLDDIEILREEFENADIVVNTATNNHLQSVRILDEVVSKKSSVTIVFHITGVSVLSTTNHSDRSRWSDITDNKKLRDLPDDKPHIEVDRTVMKMKDKNPDFARPVVISPATIYGTSEGYDHIYSVQVPVMVRKSIELGQAFVVDGGDWDWSNVHIKDLGSMFTLLLNKLIGDNGSVKTGEDGYYFVETGTHRWYDVSGKLARLLFERGVVNSTEILNLNAKEADKLFGSPLSSLYNTHALVSADLARSYGWEPSHGGEFWSDLEVSVANECGE